MVMKSTFLTLVVSGIILSTTCFAQPEIQERKGAQQGRIADGVANGSLTPHETKKLEQKERSINRQTRRDRRQNGGTLSPGQKAQINRHQNRVSRDIYRQKHDAETSK